MSFEIYLREQLKKHPSMMPCDVVKMCYQGAYGAEHLLADTDGAFAYLQKEYESVSPCRGDLYEQISDKVCRINLAPWKERGLPAEWLFRMFKASCRTEEKGTEVFDRYLQAAGELVALGEAGFTKEDWDRYLKEYKKIGMPAVHHSEEYRRREKPAYRIADSRFCRVLPILEKINECKNKKSPLVIAIDGKAASGKSTMALLLQGVLEADTVRMDDFFLPPYLRTEERFKTAGENIHRERFTEEVLPFISKEAAFCYRIFDCGKMDFNGKREIKSKSFRIVEGSYSCHPAFGAYADITVFSDVSEEEQINRIRNRNGKEMLKTFLSRWIPLEEEYFKHYGIKTNAQLKV